MSPKTEEGQEEGGTEIEATMTSPQEERQQTSSSSSSAASLSVRDINHHFYAINERPVDDISLEFFYKPHTITLLVTAFFAVFYTAFTRDDSNYEGNLWSAARCILFFFLVVSLLAFPNGPFTRPHPALWRLVFGVSVLYSLALIFILFQNYGTIKAILYWFYPDLRDFKIDSEKVSKILFGFLLSLPVDCITTSATSP